MRKLLLSSLAVLAMATAATAEEVTIRVHYGHSHHLVGCADQARRGLHGRELRT